MSAGEPVSLVHPRRSAVAAPLPMIAQATLDRDTEQGLPAHDEHDRGTLQATVTLGGLMTLAAIGPAAVPTVVGILLGVVGVVMAARAWWELRRAAPGPALPPRGRLIRLAAMIGVLVGFAVLLPVLGYVVCAALLFTGAALLLGAPHPARTAAYGWTLAGLVFLLFDRLIGLALPTGPWGF